MPKQKTKINIPVRKITLKILTRTHVIIISYIKCEIFILKITNFQPEIFQDFFSDLFSTAEIHSQHIVETIRT